MKAPRNMKSLVVAIFFSTSAISSAIGEAFNSVSVTYLTIRHSTDLFPMFLGLSTDPRLVWNYGTMAVLSGIGGILFWFSFRRLDAEDAALDNLGEGHFES
jgi:proton-dependent oligopeptide transporter, POT family